MTKKLRRRAATTRRPRATAPLQRRAVTRREYAELVVRLGSTELQMQRNRTIIDSLAQRVALLQEQVNALQAGTLTGAIGTELPSLPPATTPTVES